MLFLKECKKVVCSLAFVIYLAAAVLLPYSQGAMNFSGDKIEKPLPGQEYGAYGIQEQEDPEVIMPAALEVLYQEFLQNNYVAYPIGFYKVVHLNEQEHKQMAEVLESITGISAREFLQRAANHQGTDTTGNSQSIVIQNEQLQENPDGSVSYQISASRQKEEDIKIKQGLTYEVFCLAMGKADTIIGGGSSYRTDDLTSFCQKPVTYEQAMEQYMLTKEKDRFTGGYARLFCDYFMICVMSLFPVFLAAVLGMKDHQGNMETLVYTRKIRGSRLIWTRYGAVLTVVMIPELLLAYLSNSTVWQMYQGETLDYLAPLWYSVIWLLPTAMIVVAVGMFFTELTNTPVAIAIQGLWWLYDSNQGIWEKHGCTLFRLSPRHNTHMETKRWIDALGDFAANRLFFVGLSLLLVTGTIYIFEQKRRGRFDGIRKIRNRICSLADRGCKHSS